MNWYKLAQQQNLLFYPWDRPANKVRPRVEPEWINEDSGEAMYRCINCNEPLEEGNIILWDTPGQNRDSYTYPLHNMVPGKVVQQYNQILPLLKQYYQRFIQDWGVQKKQQQAKGDESDYWSYDWERKYMLPTPDIAQLLKSSPDLITYKEFVQNTMSKEPYGTDPLVSLISKFEGLGGLTGHEIKNLEESPPAPLLIEEVEHAIRYYKNFDIQTVGPVCEDCATVCVGCKEGIPEDQPRADLENDPEEPICMKCLDGGTYSICTDCSGAFYADEMEYIEGEGDYCGQCYQEHAPLYENFENVIDDYAEQNSYPFHAWFNDGDPEGESDKMQIPWVESEDYSAEDQRVVNLLEVLGYATSLADYRRGYTTSPGGRSSRIGKIIQRWTKEWLKTIDKTQISEQEQSEQRADVAEKGREMMNNFVNSDFRKANKLEDKAIVISENPRDVAMMSTERRWKSCMELGKGSQHNNVFCEVATGGLIAYLVQKGDDDINDPIARVLIRRYENSAGKSIAKVESAYYGSAPHGFVSQVEDWVESKQGRLPEGSGPYKIKGMSYTDEAPQTVNAFMRLKQLMKAAALRSNWYRRGKQ